MSYYMSYYISYYISYRFHVKYDEVSNGSTYEIGGWCETQLSLSGWKEQELNDENEKTSTFAQIS